MKVTRRHFLAVQTAATEGAASSLTQQRLVKVWKDPNCVCCKEWMKHLEASAFTVRAFDSGNSALHAKLGMPARLGSCHTTRVLQSYR